MGCFLKRIVDKSYFPGGIYYVGSAMETAALAAKTNRGVKLAGGALEMGSSVTKSYFLLASLLSYCLVTHYNAPKFYTELDKDPNPIEKDTNKKLFLKMVSTAYAFGAIIYAGNIWLGTRLFGIHSQSFALNSFSANDPVGTLARVCFGMWICEYANM